MSDSRTRYLELGDEAARIAGAPLGQVCYTTLGHETPWSYETYLDVGGYQAWQKILDEGLEPDDVVQIVKDSGLARGAAGAGFPTGLKWSFMPKGGGQSYFVVNSDESEPGTLQGPRHHALQPARAGRGHADRLLRDPRERSATTTCAASSWTRSTPTSCRRSPMRASTVGWAATFAAKGIDIDIQGTLGAGAYICGEETALLESLEGKKGQPRFKPPFPAGYGLYGRPTTINNTESVASVPAIVRNGPQWFKDMGCENAGGQKCFSVSGHVAKPGNFEINLGTPFATLLELSGGMRDGIPLKAVIPGGSSVPVVPGETMMETNMDYDSISKNAGSMLGSGAVIVMNETTDMVEALRRISRFYWSESCGQCTPCREGTGWLYRMLTRIVEGQGRPEDIAKLEDVAGKISGRTICALGDAAAMPVQSFVKHYRHEFEHYIEHGRSLVGDTFGRGASEAA